VALNFQIAGEPRLKQPNHVDDPEEAEDQAPGDPEAEQLPPLIQCHVLCRRRLLLAFGEVVCLSRGKRRLRRFAIDGIPHDSDDDPEKTHGDEHPAPAEHRELVDTRAPVSR
jgi:hypothetical protein